jgi:formamidopyrimidine-DNA glycosylase
MPELPEVETMVRGIRPYVAGRQIAAIRRCRSRCRPITVRPSFRSLAARLKGKTINSVERLAKRVLLRMESGDVLAIEPRMTGLMLLADPPDREHLRLELQFADPGVFRSLWFWDRRGLGTVTLYNPDELAAHLGPDRLGVDALKLTAEELQDCCRQTRRAIKVALLDQRWVAGIGNLYASEILHAARIHPTQPADDLTAAQRRRLLAATQHVLQQAIRYEGSTLGDGTYRNALSRNGRYQNEHRVYGRADQSCPSCRRGTIRRIVQAQRSTFFCPRCQRERR